MANYQSLAVKYRPQTFAEVCGQSVTVKILEKMVEKRQFKNTYLFAGDSGCGKTTLARIFANAINQGIGEPIEIDAASNNGVDNVRAIIESANQRSLTGEYKIFIIDECHAISNQGWQAFLKGIEEPPAYTIFMFCTTEPNKIPTTILNRVQRYNITKINAGLIKQRLEYICKQEGFTNYDFTCDLISKNVQGCMRDAITYLDKCSDFSTDLSLKNVEYILDTLSYEPLFKLTWALQDKNEADILTIIDQLSMNGTNLKAFIDNYLDFVINLAKFNIFKDISLTAIPAYLATKENPVVQETVSIKDCQEWLRNLTNLLLQIKLQIRYDNSYKTTIEAFLLSFCR